MKGYSVDTSNSDSACLFENAECDQSGSSCKLCFSLGLLQTVLDISIFILVLPVSKGHSASQSIQRHLHLQITGLRPAFLHTVNNLYFADAPSMLSFLLIL
jgi:hypothetical protein